MGRGGLELARERDLSALFSDTFAVVREYPGTVLAISAAIVIPVELIVSGVGLERLTGDYERGASQAEQAVGAVLAFFVIAPLVSAAVIHMMSAMNREDGPRAAASLQASLDAFNPLFIAVLIAAVGIALGLAALILPGIYLLVRWLFVAQAVVIEDRRGFDALARSGQLVRDSWWRVLAIVIASQLVAAIPALLLSLPMEAAARSADAEGIALAGDIAAGIVTAPLVAIVTTLLFYDLRIKRERMLG